MKKPMRVSFEKDLYYLTKITGIDLDEILAYCKEKNLSIVDRIFNSRAGGHTVWAEKPNQRMKILRKRVEPIDGWKLIEDVPTKKMHWLTYEKVQ